MTKRTAKKKIGIFGGSFNPIHLGHLAAARAGKEALKLDEVWFVPCSESAYEKKLWPAKTRVNLLKAVLKSHRGYKLSTVEIDRGGVSYMVETLEQLRQIYPHNKFWLMVGADQLAHLPAWKRSKDLKKFARLAVLARPGSEIKAWKYKDFSPIYVDIPLYEVTSTDIRARMRNKKDIHWMVPSIILPALRKIKKP